MIVTDPLETAEAHAVSRIRSHVARLKLSVLVWEPRPLPATRKETP